MKLRYVLPVAVLALALAFGGGSADAVFDGNTGNTINVDNSISDNSITDNSTTLVDNSLNDNSVDLGLELNVDLSLSSTDVDIVDNSNNPWSAAVYNDAFGNAIGINQANVVAGSGNSVTQTVTGNRLSVGGVRAVSWGEGEPHRHRGLCPGKSRRGAGHPGRGIPLHGNGAP